MGRRDNRSAGGRCGQKLARFQHLARRRTGNQQVQIADGFPAAAQAARGRDLLDAGRLAEIGGELVSHVFGVTQQIPASALAILRDRLQHLLFQLGAHARQHAQLLVEA